MTEEKPTIGTIDTRGADCDRSAMTASQLTLGPGSILLLSAWCGIVAGLLEVGTIVVRKTFFDPNHLYGMSRHFVWLIPTANVCLFIAVGCAGTIATAFWPRRGRWIVMRGLIALTLLPPVLIAFPRIYTMAWVFLAAGMAIRLAPVLGAHARGLVPRCPVELSCWAGDLGRAGRVAIPL